MSALPHVTVTMPSGAIEYQTLGIEIAGCGEGLDRPRQVPGTGGIAEHETRGGGADQERTAAQIGGRAQADLSCVIFTCEFMLPSASVSGVSKRCAFRKPARMIAFWMRE